MTAINPKQFLMKYFFLKNLSQWRHLVYPKKGQRGDYSQWIIINFNAIPFLSFTIHRKFLGEPQWMGWAAFQYNIQSGVGIKSIIQFWRLSKLSLSCHRDGRLYSILHHHLITYLPSISYNKTFGVRILDRHGHPLSLKSQEERTKEWEMPPGSYLLFTLFTS